MTRVAIVGAGIGGLSLAWHLQQVGLDAIVFEQAEIGSEGSGRNAGGVRQQARVPDEIPLAMLAVEFPLAMLAVELWQTLDRQLGGETEYFQGGNFACRIFPEGSRDA